MLPLRPKRTASPTNCVHVGTARSNRLARSSAVAAAQSNARRFGGHRGWAASASWTASESAKEGVAGERSGEITPHGPSPDPKSATLIRRIIARLANATAIDLLITPIRFQGSPRGRATRLQATNDRLAVVTEGITGEAAASPDPAWPSVHLTSVEPVACTNFVTPIKSTRSGSSSK